MLHLVSMVCQTNYKKLFKLYAVNLHNFFFIWCKSTVSKIKWLSANLHSRYWSFDLSLKFLWVFLLFFLNHWHLYCSLATRWIHTSPQSCYRNHFMGNVCIIWLLFIALLVFLLVVSSHVLSTSDWKKEMNQSLQMLQFYLCHNFMILFFLFKKSHQSLCLNQVKGYLLLDWMSTIHRHMLYGFYFLVALLMPYYQTLLRY